MNERILHITSRAAWSRAQSAGEYRANSLAGQGFMHCSKASQVLRVADQFYGDQTGLVLLVIDPERLNSELRWEPGTDLATELFPHIYGPLNLEAVLAALDFDPDRAGKFQLPSALESDDR